MVTTAQQITHETEVHRQHVRLKMPVQVEIDGTFYTVDDWSLGGFGVESAINSRSPGERFPARMVFPFEDFEVSLRCECQMVYVLEDDTRFGAKFLDMSRGQQALFRYLIDAYLSGELVTAGDILQVAGRDHSAAARHNPSAFNPYARAESRGRRLKRLFGYSLLSLCALLLIALIVIGVAERFFSIESRTAVIEVPTVSLRAPVPGIFRPFELAPLLVPGDPVARLETAENRIERIESPCECVHMEWLLLPGQFAQQGEEVALLAAADRPLLVRAFVELDDALDIAVGDRASIAIPGSRQTVSGRVERIEYKTSLSRLARERAAPADEQPLIKVTVRPDRPFDFDDLGSQVVVRF